MDQQTSPLKVTIANRLQILNANQEELTPVNSPVKITSLIRVGKGNREFVNLMFRYPDGGTSFYVNELMPNGQFEAIEDDEEFEEVTMFMDMALQRNQQGPGA